VGSQVHQDTAVYDNPELYESAAGLRQKADAQWVLGMLPSHLFGRCLDVGCGSGDFLAQLAAQGRVREHLVGIDRSAAMVAAAKHKLRTISNGLAVRVEQADALESPPVPGPFDLITMMAVLHWLYPAEAQVFSWIAEHLALEGTFCLTTYHPAVDRNFCGGSDTVVLEAMRRIGGPTGFPPDFLPMGRRTRPKDELRCLLQASFRIAGEFDRPAIVRVDSPRQFAKYHQATFGLYYTGLLSPELREPFLDALGEVAMDNMKRHGHVTSMEVRLWVCRPPTSKDAKSSTAPPRGESP